MSGTVSSVAQSEKKVSRSTRDNQGRNSRSALGLWFLAGLAAATVAIAAIWFRSKANAEPIETAAAIPLESVARSPGLIDPNIFDASSLGSRLDKRDLPELEISPEAFANSPSNPFSCSPIFESDTQRFCNWKADYRIARSPAEARWMAQRGYPTLAQRQLAMTSTAAGLEAEALRTGSPSLWALVMERRLAESRSSGDAELQWRALSRVAEQGRSSYALEQAALARLHVMQMTIVESGGIPAENAVAASVELQLDGALSDAAKLAVLGDPEAMSRIVRAIADEAPTQYESYANRNGIVLARLMSDAYEDLRRVSSREVRGMSAPGLGFSVADIQPRPAPILVSGNSPDGVWVGER